MKFFKTNFLMLNIFNKLVLNILILLTFFILTNINISDASVPYRNYTYNIWQQAVLSPQAYIPSKVISINNSQLGGFNNPQDIFASKDKVYLLDTGNNRIIVFNKNWEVVNVIKEFNKNDTFNNPRGIFVTEKGEIFIADTRNSRIVILNQKGEFQREIGIPKSELEGVFSDTFQYRPLKVLVNDFTKAIYVIAEGIYDGILEFDLLGSFRGFIGAPPVRINPIDLFWNTFSTDEQRRRRAIFLPTEYSNFALDEEGLIFATVASGEIARTQPVRRLNPSGVDVLKRLGLVPTVGDVGTSFSSVFIDVLARDNGIYSVLDREMGRIFTYDELGNLLYVFGGKGNTKGVFWQAIALENVGDDLLVLDSRKNIITVFKPTEYAKSIHQAIAYFSDGHYEISSQEWQKVLRRNANFDLAYTSIGRNMLRENEYNESMLYFKLGNNRAYYSDALRYSRQELIEENFNKLILIFVFIILLIFLFFKLSILKKIKENKKLKSVFNNSKSKENRLWGKINRTVTCLRYSLYVIFHPFNGFWDLKHEKKGNKSAAIIILTLVSLSYVIMRQYTGFIFNYRDLARLNILLEFLSILTPFILWCVVNWAFTTLMNGKGTFQDIFIASAYALTPLILINLPLTVISNFITLEEGSFYYFFLSFAIVWALALMFFGNMTIHDYNIAQMILTTIVVIVGMGTVLFVLLLFFSVIDVLIDMVNSIYNEITYRL